eukprot:m.184313 g.184313  ORF g.184313 m.184313 type:complete len:51 (-) comp16904_c0_seq9:2057-2209(-)
MVQGRLVDDCLRAGMLSVAFGNYKEQGRKHGEFDLDSRQKLLVNSGRAYD